MRRMFLLAGMLSLAVIPAPAEASENCVPDEGCPKGMGPPKCCKPPPCEIRQAYKEARAKKLMYYKKMGYFLVAASISPEKGGFDAEAAEMAYPLYNNAAEKAVQKAQKKFGKCPKKTRRPDPPIFTAVESDQCEIKTYERGEFKDLSLDQAQQGSESCSEIIEAKWEVALNVQSDCHLSGQDPSDYLGRAQRRGQQLEAEFQSLHNALQNYWSRCSVKRGSPIAREMAKAGIRDLQFNKPPAPKKKGPGKKSGKKGK